MTTDRGEVRALDADTYDTIEFAALAFGGIGARMDFLPSGDCVCVHGMVAQFTTLVAGTSVGTGCGNDALYAAQVDRLVNDAAVWRVSRSSVRHGRPARLRISFAAWRKALGVVRGPHPTERP